MSKGEDVTLKALEERVDKLLDLGGIDPYEEASAAQMLELAEIVKHLISYIRLPKPASEASHE